MSAVQNPNGFTLIELITVIVILGVLTAVVGPRFASSDVYDARTFYDDVYQALRYTRAKAVASGCLTQLDFTASGYRISVDSDCDSSAFTGVDVTNPDGFASGYSELRSAPSGITFSASVDPLLFDGQGRGLDNSLAVLSSNAVITIGARSLQVVGETGYVFQP